MSKRSAEHSIKGFYYQFDTTIQKILQQNNPDKYVTVEGIEDIDIHNDLYQVKYYENTNGTDSVLRKHIQAMLKHYKSNIDSGSQYDYILYAYYMNHSTINKKFDLARVKKIMQYKDKKISKNFIEEYGISDHELQGFIERFTLELSTIFGEHQENTLNIIKSELAINEDRIAEITYNNFLKIILDLAIKKNIKDRKINKNEFIEKGNNTKDIYYILYARIKGSNKYIKLIHNQYFKSKLNLPNITRIFIFNCSIDSCDEVIQALYAIETKFYSYRSKTIISKAPYVFFNKIDRKILLSIKQKICADNKRLHDGHCYQDAEFNIDELIKSSTGYDGISIKILNRQDNLLELLNHIQGTKKIYEFYDNSQPMQLKHVQQVKIQIESLKWINSIINNKEVV